MVAAAPNPAKACRVTPPRAAAASPVGAATKVVAGGSLLIASRRTTDFPVPAGPEKKTDSPERIASSTLAWSAVSVGPLLLPTEAFLAASSLRRLARRAAAASASATDSGE